MERNPDGASSVEEALQHHKTNGCSVLVAGDVPDPVVDRQVVKLLGYEPSRRRRVLGLFHRDVQVARDRLRNATPGAEPATIVASTEQPRSAAAADSSRTRPGETDDVRRVATDIESFESTLVAAIEDAVAARSPPEPGVLRVSVDSLCAVLGAYGVERSTQFVSSVGEAVRERNGMVHFVTQGVSVDGHDPTLLEAFDVLIDNRITRSGTEQRWRIPAFGAVTGWRALR